jgi:hypothetical protein
VVRKFFPALLLVTACGGSIASSSQTSPGPSTKSRDAVVWPDEGARTWSPRPTEPAITANDLRTRLYQISDDSMRGRRIGELGNHKATDYIASEFKRLGLRPAGENGTYFQELPFGPTVVDSAKARMIAGGAALSPKSEWIPGVPSATNGLAVTVDLHDTPTIFAGRWGDTLTALDPALVRGKVAVFSAPLNAPRAPVTTDSATADSTTAPARGGRGGAAANFATVNDRRARSAGAAAVLVVSLDSVPRMTANAAFNTRMAMRVNPSAGAIGAAAISRAAATKIFGKPVEEMAVGGSGQPLTATWTYDYHLAAWPGRNVIGILPGSDPARASEYVLIGAHNDHNGVNPNAVDHDSLRAFNRVMRPQGNNGRGGRPNAEQQKRIDSLLARARSIRPPRRDSIMNGADDDGSGTAVLLEIAERFATEKPARSIIIISHEGEEAGLLGSKWFVDHPTIVRDSIVAALNMDMVGKGRVTDVKFGGPSSVQTLGSRRLSKEFGDIIDSVNAVRSEPMAIDRSWDVPANPLNRFCRSDQVNYVHSNIPVTYFSTGYSIDYHMATDEPQYIDYDHAARLGRFVHDIAFAVANRRERPVISGNDPAYPACR